MRPTHYRALPAIYDRWQDSYGKNYSELILPRLLASIKKYGPMPPMLDVACGTGTLALMMARHGWSVVGIDASEGMVSEATKKAGESGLDVRFFREDMRSVMFSQHFGLVTSLYDSINHLPTVEEMVAAFACIYRSLHPGGFFFFDVNNERCFTHLWRMNQSIEHEDFTLTLENSYDTETRFARSLIRIYWPREGGGCTAEEEVIERCHSPAEIRRGLADTGFECLESCDFNFSGIRSMGKIKTWWVGRKPAK